MSSHLFYRQEWAKQSIYWQMGNIGSEVGRALAAKRQGKEKRMLSAFYRGMDLLNLTIESRVELGKSPYELLIAREQFAEAILTSKEDPKLEQYFMQFAIVEQRHK